jgi:hypothetical protein
MNSTNVANVGGLIYKNVIPPLNTARIGWMHFAYGSTTPDIFAYRICCHGTLAR